MTPKGRPARFAALPVIANYLKAQKVPSLARPLPYIVQIFLALPQAQAAQMPAEEQDAPLNLVLQQNGLVWLKRSGEVTFVSFCDPEAASGLAVLGRFAARPWAPRVCLLNRLQFDQFRQLSRIRCGIDS